MEKLMDTDPYDRAMPRKLIGQDMFGDTYPTCSTTCQDQKNCDDCPIQEAFARLRQYEQTGLTLEQIAELKERDTAMEINEIHVDEYFCPACGAENNCDQGVVEDNFCPRCGQRLKVRED